MLGGRSPGSRRGSQRGSPPDADAFYRFLAVRNGVAIIGLGYPLWRSTRTEQNEATVGGHDLRGATAVAE